MDLSHRLPYPDPDVYLNIFSDGNIKSCYRDLYAKYGKKITIAMGKITKEIQNLDETEVFACFNAARICIFNNSPKIRRDALFLIAEISKTYLTEHTLPYFLILAHDDNAQIKQDASKALAAISRKIGGLKKAKEIVISALGSMGATAFNRENLIDPEEILGKSRIAGSVCLSSSQILGVMMDDLKQNEKAELLQYIRKATEGLYDTLNDIQNSSNDTLFYSPRLRSALYKLHYEALPIPKCPHPLVEKLLLEIDPQCMKVAAQLIPKLCKEDQWKLFIQNPLYLNEFYKEFLANCDDSTINMSLSRNLSQENMTNAINLLIKNNFQNIDVVAICNNPYVWSILPEKLIRDVIKCANTINPKNVILYSKYFDNIQQIRFPDKSLPEEMAAALISVAKTTDINYIEQQWPNATNNCIRIWNKSPKTDWWSDILKENLRYYIEDDCGAISMAVPVSESSNFANLVAEVVIDRLNKGQEVTDDMWYATAITDPLIDVIIKLNPNIQIEATKKQDIYTAIYQNIIINTDESEAGELIGHISLSSQTSLMEFPNSYDFLSHFFKVVSIADVPEDIELQYLKDYFEISYSDFLLHVFLGKFDASILDSSISKFVYSIPFERRQNLLSQSIRNQFIENSVILLISADENDRNKLKIDECDILAPYLSMMNIDYDWKSDFAKFCRGEKIDISNFKGSMEELLWIATKENCPQYISNICASIFPVSLSINFHLFISALLNTDIETTKFRELLDTALQSLDNLTPLDPQTVLILSDCFAKMSLLQADELISFCSSVSSLLASQHVPSIVSCLHHSIPFFLQKVTREKWIELRNSLSQGPVSGLIEFDSIISEMFSEDDLSMFRDFPSAASRFYANFNKKDELKDLLSGLSHQMIEDELKKAQNYTIENILISVDVNSHTIHAESISTDDPFTLDVIIPDIYPLETPLFRVSSIGKEKLTQDARDEVKKECMRQDGIFAAISTWAARIDSVISKVEVCPICLSLLDAGMNLPKMKCSTCHKCCHASCLEKWLRNSLKKNCPFCRTKWHRQK